MAVMIHAHMMREQQQEENEDLLEEERAREEALGLEPRVVASAPSSSFTSSQVDPLQSATNLQGMIEAESRSGHRANDGGMNGRDDLAAIERMLDEAATPVRSSASLTTPGAISASALSSIPRERDYDAFSDLIDAMASGNASQYERTSGEDINDTDTMFPGGIMIRSHRGANEQGASNLMSYSVHPTSIASPGGTISRSMMPMTTNTVMTRTSQDGLGANDSAIISTTSTSTHRTVDLEGID